MNIGGARYSFAPLALGLCCTLCACANINTIGRQSSFGISSPTRGVAVHLDAQQRLAIFGKDGRYCAEPSPDALAAYASSLGLGASVPGTGSASASQALESAAGSIGLRTQSITLMRDALYRLCEARANGDLAGIPSVMLQTRSQDLTAVVVAVEQLTGAVVASQLALTPTASASASANLVANQQLLNQAQQDEETKRKSVEEADGIAKAQQTRVNEQQAKVTAADLSYQEATKPGNTVEEMERINRLARLNAEKATLAQDQAKLVTDNAELKRRQDLLTESTRVRQAIEDAKNAALTNSTATTGATNQFVTPAQRNQLSAEATKQIAESVKAMVTTVLGKTYIIETCLILINEEKFVKDPAFRAPLNACLDSILATAERQASQVNLETAISQANVSTAFGSDVSTKRIETALSADPTLRAKLNTWLTTNASGTSIPLLLFREENRALRTRAIMELKIP